MVESRRKIAAGLALWVAVAWGPSSAKVGEDIAGYFESYYRQEVVGGTYRGPLDFLRDAAAAHVTADRMLHPTETRSVLIDRRNGYLRIDDGAGTDQVLTMAVYRRSGGGRLLVVGSSNCADGCGLSVEFFTPGADRLNPVARDAVLPQIEPRQFVKAGHRMPDRLKSIVPSIGYVPARRGTTLTLKPWYGYEAEEQMRSAERAAVRSLVLHWDRERGRFVMRP